MKVVHLLIEIDLVMDQKHRNINEQLLQVECLFKFVATLDPGTCRVTSIHNSKQWIMVDHNDMWSVIMLGTDTVNQGLYSRFIAPNEFQEPVFHPVYPWVICCCDNNLAIYHLDAKGHCDLLANMRLVEYTQIRMDSPVHISPDGQWCMITVSENFRNWKHCLIQFQVSKKHANSVEISKQWFSLEKGSTVLAFSDDSQQIIAYNNQSCFVYCIMTGQIQHQWHHGMGDTLQAKYQHPWVIMVKSRKVKIWSIETGRLMWVGFTDNVHYKPTLSPKNDLLALVGMNSDYEGFDLFQLPKPNAETEHGWVWDPLHHVSGSYCEKVHFSPDGLLAFGGGDVFSLHTGRTILSLEKYSAVKIAYHLSHEESVLQYVHIGDKLLRLRKFWWWHPNVMITAIMALIDHHSFGRHQKLFDAHLVAQILQF